MELQEKIILLRKKHGMSQEEAAEKLGVSRQAISRWENKTAVPDSKNIVEMSKLYRVTTDYLLNDDYESDSDLPQIKEAREDNHILHANLTLIAIISQAAFLNVAMQPLQVSNDKPGYWIVVLYKFIPLLASSIWMCRNLKYETDMVQYRKNTKIELTYCVLQAVAVLFGHFTKMYSIGTILILGIGIYYILVINPKYMNRQLTKKKEKLK